MISFFSFPPRRVFSWRNLFIASVAGLSCVMPALSRHYGITWDEWMDSNYALLVLKYILSGGKNTAYAAYWHGYLYTELLFMISAWSYGLFFTPSLWEFIRHGLMSDTHLFDFFQWSHAINSLFGVLFFTATGLTARQVGGWRTACLALAMAVFSPRFFGDAMNNPKDIPFAAAYMLTIYAMLIFFKEGDRPRLRSLVFLALCFAFTLACRIGGVILLCYFVLFAGLKTGYLFFIKKEKVDFVGWGLRVTAVCAYGYLGGLFFWPYGQIQPFTHLLHSLSQISNFQFSKATALFAGQLYPVDALPFWYVPAWIALSSPPAVLLGLLAAPPLFIFLRKPSFFRFNLWLVIFTGAFPILYVILKHSVIYNGWRHLYFVYGPLVVLSAKSWEWFWEAARRRKWKAVPVFMFLILGASPLLWMIRNHPFESLYFNSLTGGLKSALGRYETDYWGVSLRKAAEWLGDYHMQNHPHEAAVVRADGYIMSTYPYLRKKMGSRYMPLGYPSQHLKQQGYRLTNVKHPSQLGGSDQWDYAIVSVRNWEPSELIAGRWPPENTLYKVSVEGVVVCAVVRNPKSYLKRS